MFHSLTCNSRAANPPLTQTLAVFSLKHCYFTLNYLLQRSRSLLQTAGAKIYNSEMYYQDKTGMDGKARCAICRHTRHQSCQTAPLMVITPPRVSGLRRGVRILWENVPRGEETAAELIKKKKKNVITESSPTLLRRGEQKGLLQTERSESRPVLQTSPVSVSYFV